jgi:dihydroorotate dehydrogenase electron transfer subunit
VYTCGSRRFARHVQRLDRQGRSAGFVFLEGLMACGLGDCHGCAIPKKEASGYYLVCRDGPHFPVGEVEL